MSWDTATPADTESVRNGAARIREFKTDVLAALTAEGIFPGAVPATPVFRWKPNYGATGSRPGTPVTGQIYVNTTLAVIERYNGASWDPIATMLPSGTVMIFYQAAAPTGWTQVTSNNDAALRVVSGSGGGTGGTDAISTGVTAHTHTVGQTSVAVGQDNVAFITLDTATPTGSAGAWAPKYIDVIACSKD